MNTYPAISPLRPELSQAGKTILITGRATGIRLTAAEGFALAGVKRIILVARSADVIESAVAKLKFSPHCKAEVIGRPCDISDIAAIDEFWSGLEQAKIIVDLLVLSVVRLTREVTIVELSYEEVWNAFNTNVRGNLILAEEFLKHIDVFPNGKKKVSCFPVCKCCLWGVLC
jgi:NAD(P)-dependent dehydrogenase (short-subunit alcohol dehydrogenase family)